MFLGSLIRPPTLRIFAWEDETGSRRNSPIRANEIGFAAQCVQRLRSQVQRVQSPLAVSAANSGITNGVEGLA